MTKVLVVDDEFMVAEVIAFALEDMGFIVSKASNGKKALEVLERDLPSLIISDFMMPVMNGLELAEALKQQSKWADLPIILMSGGHADQAQRNTHLFDFILQKPFNFSVLAETVVRLIGTDDR
jgi:two-component system response regulator VicR